MAEARPARITVVGLGPAGPEFVPTAAAELLEHSEHAFVRTARHPAAGAFARAVSFDRHYEEAGTFDEVYDRIVNDLVAAAGAASATGDTVVYAVPGSPLVAERTVELLRADHRVELTIVPAVSFLDLAWARLGVDPLAAGVRLVDGTRFAEHAAGERGPLLVAQVWSASVLSEVKLSVDDPSGTRLPRVVVLRRLGLADESVTEVAWEDLDRVVEADHLTSLYIPELAAPVAAELVSLTALVRRLRQDCPWDRVQTHASLARHLLEESYEVLDAIDALVRAEESGIDEPSAVDHLEEELGDLLFQVYFHSLLCTEEGRFTLADVARRVRDKLVSRHPHVFGDAVADDAAAVLGAWEQLKKAEKGRSSVTDGIPMALPALALAAKLQRKARAVPGFDPDPVAEVTRCAERGLSALASAGTAEGEAEPPAPLVAAAADLLWAAADLARRAGVEPEEALRGAALRFTERVRTAEGL